jgi:hypothetical protein
MDNGIIIRKAEFSDLEYVFSVIRELENEQFDFDSLKTIYKKNIVNPEYCMPAIRNHIWVYTSSLKMNNYEKV